MKGCNRPCAAILALFVAPLVVGGLIGLAIANSLIVALEDAQRERRERLSARQGGSWADADFNAIEHGISDTELRWLIWDTHERGPVIETVRDGGEAVNVN